MRPISLAIAKIRTRKKLIAWGSIIFVLALILGGYFLATREEAPIINLAGLLTALKSKVQEKPKEVVKETPPEIEITIPKSPKIYEEEAQKGDGITHLARRALKKYLREKGINLTPEQKIYAEDYIQNKTGNHWLKIGEKLTFSQELIEEAVQKSQKLTPEQLENLSHYAQLVPELNY